MGFIYRSPINRHIIGFYQRRGLAFFENGQVAIFSNQGSFDTIKGKGSYERYDLHLCEEGSTAIGRVKGTLTPIEGTMQRSIGGTQEYNRGPVVSKETRGAAHTKEKKSHRLPVRAFPLNRLELFVLNNIG